MAVPSYGGPSPSAHFGTQRSAIQSKRSTWGPTNRLRGRTRNLLVTTMGKARWATVDSLTGGTIETASAGRTKIATARLVSNAIGWSEVIVAQVRARLCTPSPYVPLRSSSTSALVAPCTYRACHHRRPSLPGGCCICLEQSAGDSTIIAVIASFLQ